MNGSILVITGPMFSGKSTELLKLYNRFKGKDICQLFSSKLDNRYTDEEKVYTHDGESENAELVSSVDELIRRLSEDTRHIFIDEIHLIKGDVSGLCMKLANQGRHIYVSGLDLDYMGKPFREISVLMADADEVVKKSGTCSICGKASRYSYRTGNEKGRLVVGAADKYEPRCRGCFKSSAGPVC